MNKNGIILIVFLLFTIYGKVVAQENIQNFFDSKGDVAIQTTEMDAMADTIAVVNHRADDVVWSRVVYRIIDMRERQNYQLYFPLRQTNEYKSLFKLMIDAVVSGKVPVYRSAERSFKPNFNDPLTGEDLSKAFAYNNEPDYNLIQVDKITRKLKFENTQYNKFVENQVKFLVREIVFFDKHTSRMYSKIIAIAPLYSSPDYPQRSNPDNKDVRNTMTYFRESVICWFSFDQLRAEMSKQYVIPNGNDSQRLTYDEFFAQRLYSTYLVGDSNMFNRMITDNYVDETNIRKEQKRIETELLNIEQDLWEY